MGEKNIYCTSKENGVKQACPPDILTNHNAIIKHKKTGKLTFFVETWLLCRVLQGRVNK